MKHFASPAFWFHYRQLPEAVRTLADKNFVLLAREPHLGSLRFRPVAGPLWSVRVGLHYRALARQRAEGFVWV